MSYIQKSYVGAAPTRTLSTAISAGDTSIVINSGTDWPDGASYPFVIVINRGNATEEKILVTSRSGTTLTVNSRGYDDTTAASHGVGETVEHVLDAQTIAQANRYVNLQTAKAQLVSHNGTNATVLTAPDMTGTDNGKVLLVDSTDAVGFAYGQVDTAGIANDAITIDKVADNAVDTAQLVTGAVTSDILDSNSVATNKIQNSAVTTAKIDPTVLAQFPKGVVAVDSYSNTAVTTDTEVASVTFTAVSGRQYSASAIIKYDDSTAAGQYRASIELGGTKVFTVTEQHYSTSHAATFSIRWLFTASGSTTVKLLGTTVAGGTMYAGQFVVEDVGLVP
jgi:hypothetical protein